ncbi:unnamed protein product, partial [Prorocentrum cordatum]
AASSDAVSLDVFRDGLQILKDDGVEFSPVSKPAKDSNPVILLDSDDDSPAPSSAIPAKQLGALLPAEMVSLAPRTAKRRLVALEAREKGAAPFTPAAGKKRRSSKGPGKSSGEKDKRAPVKKPIADSAGSPTEPLEKAVARGPTSGKAPRYELCAKGRTSGKRVFLCSLTASNPSAGDFMKSLVEHVNATNCNKIEALK